MLRYECDDAGSRGTGVGGGQIASAGVGTVTRVGVDVSGRSALLTAADTIDRAEPRADTDADLDSAAAALRSWVVGWTHRFDPLGSRRAAEPNPAAVRRLVEAVIDVLLERRPAEQVKRWVSREVFALLSTVTQRRAATRFAARSMVRSIQLHAPGPDAVESTVLVQDGPRVRAVALRFERSVAPGFDRAGSPQDRWDRGGNAGFERSGSGQERLGRSGSAGFERGGSQERLDRGGSQGFERGGGGGQEQSDRGVGSGQGFERGGSGGGQERLEWRCTALQFA